MSKDIFNDFVMIQNDPKKTTVKNTDNNDNVNDGEKTVNGKQTQTLDETNNLHRRTPTQDVRIRICVF